MPRFPKQKPGWLVWVIRPNGAQVLRAITTQEKLARRYEKYLPQAEPKQTVRVYVEETRLNHLYLGMMMDGEQDRKLVLKALKAANRAAKADETLRRAMNR